ncbi:unnamed protein product [Linum tenue]|uniref:MORF/ORRM1/DAG-like MORF domain-containing protein n=1 Tax=Linum tenue TaxID=586396 RepID=A0AAV0JDS9_9ROSI|nr:unnamed protein product [Linum tenue]
MLPGCDYNHWLIVMDFPKDPAPSREQMIDAYLNTLATVLGRLDFVSILICNVSSRSKLLLCLLIYLSWDFQAVAGLPGVLWVLPDSYIDVKNKDYGGDKYVNGEIIPCTYPTYQPKQRKSSKYESKRYERRRDGPPANQRSPSKPQSASSPESSSSA